MASSACVGIAALQGLGNRRMLLGHLRQMAGHRRAQLPHPVEMHLGQRDEFPDARIAADPRDGGVKGVIHLEIILEAVLCQDHPHAGDDGVQLRNVLRR